MSTDYPTDIEDNEDDEKENKWTWDSSSKNENNDENKFDVMKTLAPTEEFHVNTDENIILHKDTSVGYNAYEHMFFADFVGKIKNTIDNTKPVICYINAHGINLSEDLSPCRIPEDLHVINIQYGPLGACIIDESMYGSSTTKALIEFKKLLNIREPTHRETFISSLQDIFRQGAKKTILNSKKIFKKDEEISFRVNSQYGNIIKCYNRIYEGSSNNTDANYIMLIYFNITTETWISKFFKVSKSFITMDEILITFNIFKLNDIIILDASCAQYGDITSAKEGINYIKKRKRSEGLGIKKRKQTRRERIKELKRKTSNKNKTRKYGIRTL